MTGVEERDASLHPSPSMTAMGGQDDAVVCSARGDAFGPMKRLRRPKRSVE
jgi:hypothetical protein